MTKILAESLYEYRELYKKEEEVDPLTEELNEGLNSKQLAALEALVAKSELAEDDIAKYGKFIDKVLKSFSLAQPGTSNGDLALKYRKQIMADKVKYAPYVLKFLKTFQEWTNNKKAARLFGFNPNTKKLDIRLGKVGKAGVGTDLGQ